LKREERTTAYTVSPCFEGDLKEKGLKLISARRVAPQRRFEGDLKEKGLKPFGKPF